MAGIISILAYVCFAMIGLSEGQSINCGGKFFTCTDSTHFLICVDFGNGQTQTIGTTPVACPANLICSTNNQLPCDKTVATTKVTPKTPTTLSVPKCPRNGAFGDDKDCSTFYICVGTLQLKLVCPPETVFSRSQGICTFNKNECGQKSFNCLTAGKFADPTSCYNYFECSSTPTGLVATKFTCPFLQSFYPFLNKCFFGFLYCKIFPL